MFVASVSVQVHLNREGKRNVSSLWLRWKNEINIFCINEKQFEPSTVRISTPKNKSRSSERKSTYLYSYIVFYVCWSAKNAIEVEICKLYFLYN